MKKRVHRIINRKFIVSLGLFFACTLNASGPQSNQDQIAAEVERLIPLAEQGSLIDIAILSMLLPQESALPFWHNLIAGGVDITQPIEGQSLLSAFALEKEKEAIVDLLLQQGADPNETDGKGMSLLSKIASELELEKTAEVFLKHGANPNALNSYYSHYYREEYTETVLQQAIFRSNYPMVNVLLAYKADPNLPNSRGETPLFGATSFLSQVLIMQALLAAGADPNQANKKGRTPLFEAVFTGDQSGVALLLKYGARADIKDIEGTTPLHCIKADWQPAHAHALLLSCRKATVAPLETGLVALALSDSSSDVTEKEVTKILEE